MDPCTMVAELLLACEAEGGKAIQVGQNPAVVMGQQFNRGNEVVPAARASLPETAKSCDSSKPKMGCSLPSSESSDPASNQPDRGRNQSPGADRQAAISAGLPPALRPASGDQLFAFRLATLRAGELYTRATPERYVRSWRDAPAAVSYHQWKSLLSREAAVMAQSQGNNRLTVLLGDSLSLWLPMEQLPRDRFWLNQSISGETTGQILRRLHYFQAARPDQIHIMAGINDLKNGASDSELIGNIQQMLALLQQQHPQAELVIYSILPTRLGDLPSSRIQQINQYIAYVAQQYGATYVDLQSNFADRHGLLRRDLTTDGLHLSRLGYEVWRSTLVAL